MLQKNWGFGSGISLFIAAGVAQSIIWDSIGPISPVTDHKYLGAILAFFQTILAPGFNISSFTSWQGALYRGGNLPDMLGFLTTILVFVIVIYLNGLRVEIPVSYARYRGYRGQFPIKLFYVSNIPVIFAAALFGNIYFIGQLVFNRYNSTCSNFWLGLVPGCFTQSSSGSGQLVPTQGLAYYTFAPHQFGGFGSVIADPLRAAIYAGVFVLACVFFAVTWVIVAGIPGVGKTTVLQELETIGHEKHIPVKVVNFGDVMNQIFKKRGRDLHRDHMRRQDLNLQTRIQQQAARTISRMKGSSSLVVDTHMFVRTIDGLWPGTPKRVLDA